MGLFNRKRRENSRSGAPPKPADRPIVQIVVKQAEKVDGSVAAAVATFSGEPTTTTLANVPVDAVGDLILRFPKLTNVHFVDLGRNQLPTEEEMVEGRLYFAAKPGAGGGWVAMLGGKGIHTPTCGCARHHVDWHLSKVWESRKRAVGMLFLANDMTTKVFIIHDAKLPIRLVHPSETAVVGATDDGHCVCCP